MTTGAGVAWPESLSGSVTSQHLILVTASLPKARPGVCEWGDSAHEDRPALS